jgi:hypothetical protein
VGVIPTLKGVDGTLYEVGALGLVNCILKESLGYTIAAKFSDEEFGGKRRFEGFCIYEKLLKEGE